MRIGLLPISEKKQLISGDKKHSEKTSLFQEIKIIFPAVFFLLVFFVACITFLSNKSIFFIYVLFISLSSLNFSKIVSMVLFS